MDRIPKDTDQEDTNKAISIIIDTIKDHPEIEPTLWLGAFFFIYYLSFKSNDFTKEEFLEELQRVADYYTKDWDI